MESIDLNVRYFQDSTPEGVACREENFQRREISMKLPIRQTALVAVDVWDIHHDENYVERMNQALEQFLLPALHASRKTGIRVIHAPGPEIAENRFADRIIGVSAEPCDAKEPIWPFKEFRERTGDYEGYRGPREQYPGVMAKYERLWDLSPKMDVLENEFVIATGGQLDAVCRDNGILHLLYVGFLANWCVLCRDYGIRAKARQGYNTIILRDAIAGTEYPDTIESGLSTEFAIREVEQQYGFSVSNEDFLEACTIS